MSTREIGKGLTPQHANGCTIDGDLIDISMADLVHSINNIPPRHLKRRWMQTQFVNRIMPVPYTAPTLVQGSLPWLPMKNDSLGIVGGVLPATGIQNEWRNKGTHVADYGTVQLTDRGGYAWTQALYFETPAIITGFSARMWQPSIYAWDNDWSYHVDPPVGKTLGQSMDDFFIEITSDNPFNIENRRLNDIDVHKLRFPVSGNMMATNLAVPTNDLSVASLPMRGLQLWVNLDNLCIPLHENSRIRVSLGIPRYAANGGVDDASGWQGTANIYLPWQSTSFATTLTVLEPTGRV